MPEDATPRIHPMLRPAALTLVFLLIAILGARQTGSLDAGHHLQAGRGILAGQGLPREEALTFASSGHELIDTSWGYQVLAALVHLAAGPSGLSLFHAAVILATFLLMGLTARMRSADTLVLAVLLLLGALASEPRFEAGPELLSCLLLALTLWVLHRYATLMEEPRAADAPRRAGRLLPALLLVQLLWVNVDGLFVLGWLAMGCCVAGLWIASRRPDPRLAAWSGGAVAATLINPYGWRGVAASLGLAGSLTPETLSGPANVSASPFQLLVSGPLPPYPRAAIACYLILALLSLAALPGAIRKKRFWCLLLWLPFLVLSARSVRNIPWMVIACLPWMAWASNAAGIFDAAARRTRVRMEARRARTLLTGLAAALVFVTLILTLRVATDGHYVGSRRLARTGLGWNRLIIPVDAAEFAARAGLDRVRVLNHASLGGWLRWSLGSQVYFDPRLAIDEALQRRYEASLGSLPARDGEVLRFGIGWIIFPYASEPKLLLDLSADPEWILAYVDHLSAVFVRVGTEAQGRIDPNLVSVFDARSAAPRPEELPGLGSGEPPGPMRAWLSGIWRRQHYPVQDRNLGLFHYSRGEIEHASARFSMAIARSGGAFYEIYGDLGSSLFHMGEFRLAREALRVVLSRDPHDRLATRRLEEMASLPDI